MASTLLDTPRPRSSIVQHGRPLRTAAEGASTNPAAPSSRKSGTRSSPMEPNVNNVVFGNLLIKPWYPSFYPEELIGRTTERLYVCQWCFKYSKELIPFLGHVKVCPLKGKVPEASELVYSKDDYSLYEVDGEDQKFYTQNLSLFAKLFLDTKSVFYDTSTFLYYVLVCNSTTPGITNLDNPPCPQVVGFFSKEKMSWDNNNLACILIFPPWQRKGLGQILMGASYELSKKEQRIGGPEKPLSTLGRLAYTSFWSHTLARALLSYSSTTTSPVSVRELSKITYIVPEDIVSTLQSMQILESHKDKDTTILEQAYINRGRLKEWAEKHNVMIIPPVDPNCMVERQPHKGADGENDEEGNDYDDNGDDDDQ